MARWVRCPRCGLRVNAKVHSIISADAGECPRCASLDSVEIPMAVDRRDPDRPGSEIVRGMSRRCEDLAH